MALVEANISMSLDGYVTGPELDRFPGLGRGGEVLHAWLDEYRDSGLPIGVEPETVGAVITSRRVHDATGGWAAEDGCYGMPVFVLTHRPHDVVVTGVTTFTFVTDGIRGAVARAVAAAGSKRVHIMGGAGVIRQALAAGLVDELVLHVAPVLLGGGTRLFEHLDGPVGLERTGVVESVHATHLRHRVLR